MNINKRKSKRSIKMKKYLVISTILATALAITALVGCGTGNVNAANPGANAPITGAKYTAGDGTSQPAGIWVSGTGTVTVVPDIAILSVGVSDKEITVVAAQATAADAMTKLIAALKANGIADKDIQTTGYSIQQVTRYDNIKNEVIPDGYNVSNTVNAKIRALDKVGAIIDAVATAGGDATRINGVSIQVEKPEGYFGEARGKAMADAKAKADQLASLAGMKLGAAYYITENSGYTNPPIPYFAKDMAGGIAAQAVTPISAGETEVTLTVQVAYAIVP
jgi:uncharacterized protein YggE